MAAYRSLKLALLLPYSLFVFNSFTIYVHALTVNVTAIAPSPDAVIHDDIPCSRKCESDYCGVPPFLKYGKYCGLLYSGCPGEEPCDDLDACCMKHDLCIGGHGNAYLSQNCSEQFLECMAKFKDSNGKTFQGNTCDKNTVVDLITIIIEAALVAGRVLHQS